MENTYRCAVCGLSCGETGDNPLFDNREVVFRDETTAVCSDCSIDYEVDERGRIVLRKDLKENFTDRRTGDSCSVI